LTGEIWDSHNGVMQTPVFKDMMSCWCTGGACWLHFQ